MPDNVRLGVGILDIPIDQFVIGEPNGILLEDGDTLVTEAGDRIITET